MAQCSWKEIHLEQSLRDSSQKEFKQGTVPEKREREESHKLWSSGIFGFCNKTYCVTAEGGNVQLQQKKMHLSGIVRSDETNFCFIEFNEVNLYIHMHHLLTTNHVDMSETCENNQNGGIQHASCQNIQFCLIIVFHRTSRNSPFCFICRFCTPSQQ